MFKMKAVFLLVLAFAAQSFAGVIHESKTAVKFKGLGEYTTHEMVYVQGLKQHKESTGNFQGEGMMGQMVGRMMFGNKQKGEITDLNAMKIFELFHAKKQYRVQPIEKFQFNEERRNPEEAKETGEKESEENKNIKIVRQVFKVVPTNKKKTIHNFPCQEYQIFWISEWQNTETGEKGKDSLFTDVWATKATNAIEKGLKEEQAFQQAYLQKVGIDVDFETHSLLGLNWIQMFRAMHKQPNAPADITNKKWVKEMKKIEGYPVVIDGKFYISSSEQKKMQQKKSGQEFNFNNPTGMFGNMLKNGLKKKAKQKTVQKNEPAFTYHTELIKIEAKNLSGNRFKVPEDYQQIN